jgi:hypothetical protein
MDRTVKGICHVLRIRRSQVRILSGAPRKSRGYSQRCCGPFFRALNADENINLVLLQTELAVSFVRDDK